MPSNVQLKGNTPAAPWWVIEGTPAEILFQIEEVFGIVASGPSDFPFVVAKAREAWAAEVEVSATLGATPVAGATASPAQAAAGPAQRTGTETDKWGNTYEWGHPKAPLTPSGAPAVLKRGRSQQGKDYAKWIDPRDKYIPSVYASGQKVNPPDLWPGDWARGV